MFSTKQTTPAFGHPSKEGNLFRITKNVFVSANVEEFLLWALKPLGVARGASFFGV